MEEKAYIFDTNIISALLRQPHQKLLGRISQDQTNVLVLCEPVVYEVERGLEHKQATKQLQQFRQDIIPLFTIIGVQFADWRVASKLWANARRDGKQLSDIDLLLAAISLRLRAILITDDGDFAHVPLIETQNWLQGESSDEG